jgi:hypothetical protein
VEFIEEALETLSLDIPPAARAEAIEGANVIINTNFYRHPGFLLDAFDSYQYQIDHTAWNWSAGLSELAFFDSPDQPTRALVGFSVTAREWQPGLGLVPVPPPVRDVVSMQVCTNEISFADGRNLVWRPDIQCSKKGLLDVMQQDREIFAARTLSRIPASISPFLKSISLRSGGAASPPIAALKGTAQGFVVAPIVAGTSSSELAGIDTGQWDSVLSAPTGEFITGVALGSDDSTAKVTGAALNTTLGPHFEARVGGPGGTHLLLQCQSNQIPVGLRLKSGVLFGFTVVSYFGVICADKTRLVVADNAANRRIVRGSFFDAASQQFLNAGNFLASSENFGTTDFLCPVGGLIRGVVTKSGTFVDRIVTLLCTNGSLAVGVGGVGGVLGTSDCTAAPGPALSGTTRSYSPYLFVRTGDILDSLAVGCFGPYHFVESFETSTPAFFDDQPDGAPPFFGVRTGTIPGGTIGPAAGTGSKYIFGSSASASPGQEKKFRYPNLDLRGMVDGLLEMRFKWYLAGTSMDTTIQLWAGPVGQQPQLIWNRLGVAGEVWNAITNDLGLFSGSLIDVILVVKSGTGSWRVAFDDVHFDSVW